MNGLKIANYYWPKTEQVVESIQIPYHLYENDVVGAVAAMRQGSKGANAKILAYLRKCMEYWNLLGDSPGDLPYRAGGVILNSHIQHIRDFGSSQEPPWVMLPEGINIGPSSVHCYQPWLPYNP